MKKYMLQHGCWNMTTPPKSSDKLGHKVIAEAVGITLLILAGLIVLVTTMAVLYTPSSNLSVRHDLLIAVAGYTVALILMIAGGAELERS